MKVVYIVERFPTFSETFVYDEIASHIESGMDIRVAVLNGGEHADYPVSQCGLSVQQRTVYLGVPRGRGILEKAQIVMLGLAAALKGRHFNRLSNVWRDCGLSLRELMSASKVAIRFPEECIIHCHFGNIGRIGLAIQALSRTRKHLFVTFHAHEMTKQWFLPLNRYYASLFRSNAKLLPISDHWRSLLVEAGANSTNIATHYMGVKPVAMPTARTAKSGTLKLIMVGRMVEKKGHVYAIEAMKRLHECGHSFECDLIGDGPLNDEIKHQIKKFGLTTQVQLLGSLSHQETLRRLAEADIFVLPCILARDGDMEGIPVSLMEAMARNVAVVSTWHSGIPELIEHGVSGILVPQRDVDELAKAIANLIANPVKRHRLAANGKMRVEKYFNQKQLAQKLRQRYRQATET